MIQDTQLLNLDLGSFHLPPDGYSYEGDWKDDVKDGLGKLKYPSGEIIETPIIQFNLLNLIL